MTARRMPSSLATHARTCGLFLSGQRCATCPEAASDGCPIKDIEDVPAHILARRAFAAAPAGTVGVQCHGAGLGLGLSRPTGGITQHRTMRSVASARRVDAGSEGDVPVVKGPQQRCRTLQEAEGKDTAGKAAGVHVVAPQPAEVKKSVSLSSQSGRRMFKEALAVKSLQPYFNLSEQMVFQPDVDMRPVTCLSVVLNALGHDPHKAWKPIWRWNTEEVLLGQETGARSLPADKIRCQQGMQLHELAELARNNGARAQAFPACPSLPFNTLPLLARPHGEEVFRRRLQDVCASALGGQGQLIVHMLSPSGEWKYAPVAGYHAGSDSVLLLDLDRTAAPRWMQLTSLWTSMCASSAGKSGGYVTVGSMACEAATPEVPLVAGCPRVLRSWGEGKLVVGPVPETATAGEVCPLGVWAAASWRVKVVAGRSQRASRHAMRLGSASSVKSRSRVIKSSHDATPSAEEAMALAGFLLQSWPLGAQGVQGRTMAAAGGRSVHSSRVDALAAPNVEEIEASCMQT